MGNELNFYLYDFKAQQNYLCHIIYELYDIFNMFLTSIYSIGILNLKKKFKFILYYLRFYRIVNTCIIFVILFYRKWKSDLNICFIYIV